MNFIRYVSRTIYNEINQTKNIINDILDFHLKTIKQKKNLRTKKKLIRKRLKYAKNFKEWTKIAKEHDNLVDVKLWKETLFSKYYDYKYILSLYKSLKTLRENEEIYSLIHLLRANLYRNLSGLTNPKLYEYCYNGSKTLIEEFYVEVINCLEFIAKNTKINKQKKIEFFSETKHAFGNTAILLSGGAGFGMFHNGILKNLHLNDCLPKIIAGSSVGSIVASIFATKNKEEIDKVCIFYIIFILKKNE